MQQERSSGAGSSKWDVSVGRWEPSSSPTRPVLCSPQPNKKLRAAQGFLLCAALCAYFCARVSLVGVVGQPQAAGGETLGGREAPGRTSQLGEQQAGATQAQHAKGEGTGTAACCHCSSYGTQLLASRRRGALLAGDGMSPWNWTFYQQFSGLDGLAPSEAEAHYWKLGQFSGSIAAPFALVLKYHASGGLCNQLYAHIHAIIMARALGRDWGLSEVGLFLPPAMWRRSYGDASEQTKYFFSPVGTLLDGGRIIEHWAPRGLRVRPTPEMRVYPKLPSSFAYHGKLRYELLGERCLHVRVRGVPHPAPWSNYSATSREAVKQTAQPVLLGDPANQVPCVHLDTHSTFLQVETTPNMLGEAREAAEGIFFNRTLEALADEVIACMDPASRGFNGVHFRIEEDSVGWHAWYGGKKGFVKAYFDGMRKQGFSRKYPVYVASGVLSYNNTEDVAKIEAWLLHEGLGSAMVYKERCLPPERLSALHSEQQALLDFLVLLRGSNFVGFGGSSFSYMLGELRHLRGLPKQSTHLLFPDREQTNKFDLAGRLSRD